MSLEIRACAFFNSKVKCLRLVKKGIQMNELKDLLILYVSTVIFLHVMVHSAGTDVCH